MIRLFFPAILATTMLTAATAAHAAGGLYKHDASIASYSYSIPIVDTSGNMAQTGTTLRQDLDKGYQPTSAPRPAPVYQKNSNYQKAPAAKTGAAASNGGIAANLQGIAQGNAPAAAMPPSAQLNAGGSAVGANATTAQAGEISPTTPVGRNSADSIRSQGQAASAPASSGVITTNNVSGGANGSASVSGPLGNASVVGGTTTGVTNPSGAANGGSGYTGDASNSGSTGSTSTSNGGVGGANGGSSSVGGGSAIGNASGGSLGGGAGAGASGGGQ